MSAAKPRSRGGLLRVVHHHPGRIRVRATVFEDQAEPVETARVAVLALPGVSEATHNPRTGSLLVVYEPLRTDPNDVLQCIVDAADLDEIIDEADAREDPGLVREQIARGSRTADDVVLEVTGGRVDLRTLVGGALLAGSVYAFVAKPKDARVPRWDNLLWWSYSVLSGDLTGSGPEAGG